MVIADGLPLAGRAAALVALGALIALGVNAARPGGLRFAAFAPPTMCGAEAEAAPSQVTVGEAQSLCNRGDVVIADARSAERYAQGHIADAAHLPCTASETRAATALARLGDAHTIIVYGESTTDAVPVAESLKRRAPGLDVRVLTGGFPAWERAGFACASGACEGCKANHDGHAHPR